MSRCSRDLKHATVAMKVSLFSINVRIQLHQELILTRFNRSFERTAGENSGKPDEKTNKY